MSRALTDPPAPRAAREHLLTSTQSRPHKGRASRRLTTELQTWRLHRVQAYVQTHISDPIRSADLAKAAGLSRMYFAAQFRAKMNVRPHEYLVGQRIAQAQSLLKASQTSIADVALSVGFKNQAHFTTVFLRFTGSTPRRWRSTQ
jgi:AraC family transcriptional regulator